MYVSKPCWIFFSKIKRRLINSIFAFTSLCRQVAAINHLANKGMYFWDYGNAFLLEAGRAG